MFMSVSICLPACLHVCSVVCFSLLIFNKTITKTRRRRRRRRRRKTLSDFIAYCLHHQMALSSHSIVCLLLQRANLIQTTTTTKNKNSKHDTVHNQAQQDRRAKSLLLLPFLKSSVQFISLLLVFHSTSKYTCAVRESVATRLQGSTRIAGKKTRTTTKNKDKGNTM